MPRKKLDGKVAAELRDSGVLWFCPPNVKAMVTEEHLAAGLNLPLSSVQTHIIGAGCRHAKWGNLVVVTFEDLLEFYNQESELRSNEAAG